MLLGVKSTTQGLHGRYDAQWMLSTQSYRRKTANVVIPSTQKRLDLSCFVFAGDQSQMGFLVMYSVLIMVYPVGRKNSNIEKTRKVPSPPLGTAIAPATPGGWETPQYAQRTENALA
jgi:hypothetical protein